MRDLYECALNQAKSVEDYRAWFELAEKKATIDVTAAEHNVDIDTSELNRAFCAYAMKKFWKAVFGNQPGITGHGKQCHGLYP